MNLLKIIVLVFLIYFIRRVWGLYKLMTTASNNQPHQKPQHVMEAEYKVLSEENP
jgi:hypothetical protein